MLKCKNIILRQIEESDLKSFRDWRNSDIIRPNLREYRPLNMINQKTWFESLSSSNNIMFSIYCNSNLIGCCGLTYIDWKNGNAEISIYLGESQWQKKGYASKSVQLLLEYGFNELRLHRIFVTIFEYNIESIKLFEKNGFQYEGTHHEARYWNGSYHNEIMYSIIKNEYEKRNRKKVVAVIQARMGSTRLPEKVLKKILDKSMLQLMIERVQNSKTIDDIIVATTTSTKDDEIVLLCKNLDINVFRGSDENVLQRVSQAVNTIKGDIIVELTGDCPLVDWNLIDKMVYLYKANNVDYISNCHPYTFPEGFDIEIFSNEKLQWINEHVSDSKVKEHVSLYFYENPNKYKLMNYTCDVNRGHWHLSVDEESDFQVVKNIFENLYLKNKKFTVYDVINYLDKHPEIKKINDHVKLKNPRE